ncbi:hypothetical protein [Microcystis aeruginosa]|uniref:Uncharacterized protein n=1 Tax=Microcystis aeruginosa NIES-3807 TaxID=2517785 RepID=A0AAD3G9A7_MICAE|nr:hypothetical protein [Microcystis aeruginosa]GCL59540.1 hypothetical protein NIES3807_27160 [Microcystis aeruginosa NIES-3807]
MPPDQTIPSNEEPIVARETDKATRFHFNKVAIASLLSITAKTFSGDNSSNIWTTEISKEQSP